jgi:hypothetical protein
LGDLQLSDPPYPNRADHRWGSASPLRNAQNERLTRRFALPVLALIAVLTCAAYGMDFPASHWRYSRLT